ncbi:hypothetical protein K4L44_12580 [Halosquirtibacter laminarini]|uniref:Uncharacterized protein n=1 Tax=Halosquirtibacter laminarini TaxID=3374600 RepID=A0AC61ND66_9BACT|nr:hypothetical protein K4L44_12580 [Prolixibacteraceae bacterium]
MIGNKRSPFAHQYNDIKRRILDTDRQEKNRSISQYISNVNSYFYLIGTDLALESLQDLELHLDFGSWYIERSEDTPNILRIIHLLEHIPVLLHFYIPENNTDTVLKPDEKYISKIHRLHQILLKFSIRILKVKKDDTLKVPLSLLAFEIIQDIQIEYLAEGLEPLFIPLINELEDRYITTLIIIMDHYYIGLEKKIPQEIKLLLEHKLENTNEGILAIDILVMFQNIGINTQEESLSLMNQWQKAKDEREHFKWDHHDFDDGYDDIPGYNIESETYDLYAYLESFKNKHFVIEVLLAHLFFHNGIDKELLIELCNQHNLSLISILNQRFTDMSCFNHVESVLESSDIENKKEIILNYLYIDKTIGKALMNAKK